VAGGVVSQAPIRRSAGVVADAMTMCPGTGLLIHVIERGLMAGSCRVAGAPGERQQWRAVASAVLLQVRGKAEPDISESL
jgi:hypothetical protein